ncbi:flagellar assembly protein A [Massilia jejuensis]|uniref:Flagellar assembly protein A n=1 Tax=Massilia jejuensis TaxID=648894 RepID=A0ABW0PJR2_9BURK
MNVSDAAIPVPPAPGTPFDSTGPGHCIMRHPDGIYADPDVLGTTVLAAIDSILRSGSYLSGVDYAVLVKALYDSGPALPTGPDGRPLVRLANDILPFDVQRRALYRSVRIAGGVAEYCFEPVFLAGPEGEEIATRLDLDEFVADMWTKGIRFGIDVAAVRAGIGNPGLGRTVVARRLEPVAGVDAVVVEVSDDIHRSDAPRQLSNGKLDLMCFQNRFPQVQGGTKLLQKLPPRAGQPGVELSGILIAPAAPADLDLSCHAGEGTRVERDATGHYLVAARTGFLQVDPKTRSIAVGDKVVSHDGVSARTTGNLQLTGDYEEFGDIQEKRVIEGNGITVHGNVYGDIFSRGGMVRLHANLVGGSIHNKRGDIQVDGVTANAILQATGGAVVLQRAENCVISGTRVRIERALNCEIIADEVSIGDAEGCAVAARRLAIDSTAPWRGSEMLVYALAADCGRIDAVLEQIGARLAQFDAAIARHKAEVALLCAEPGVRNYLEIAGKVRSGETHLSPAQAQQFKQMRQGVAACLTRIGEVANARKAVEAERAEGEALLARFSAQRSERAAGTAVTLGQLKGETQVRRLAYDPDGACFYDLPAREIKARLRGNEGETLHAAACGSYTLPGA